jgi:hypothetical protein
MTSCEQRRREDDPAVFAVVGGTVAFRSGGKLRPGSEDGDEEVRELRRAESCLGPAVFGLALGAVAYPGRQLVVLPGRLAVERAVLHAVDQVAKHGATDN